MFVAVLVPARRVAKIDPREVLTSESTAPWPAVLLQRPVNARVLEASRRP